MEEAAAPQFLDPNRLLESSRPRPRVNLVWWVGGVFLLIVLGTSVLGGQWVEQRQVFGLVSALAMAGLIMTMSALSIYTVRRFRAEQQRVEQIGEFVQLRRWPEAGMAVEQYLSQPSRTQALRVQALFYFSTLLARLQRFQDAITVQNQVLAEDLLDAATAAMLRIGRAMAMLREDHLFDADRAISELRRSPVAGSGALALVEIYRDVKTGHPTEAIELFEQKLPVIRDQLGHRAGDAYALAARAYDLSGRQAEARDAFHKATLLCPAAELVRKYPEVQKLSGRYDVAAAPPEAA